MYLTLIFILGLAAFSQQHCNKHHHDYSRNRVKDLVDYHTKVFDEVANDVIALDRKSRQLCQTHSNSAATELYQKNRYVLKTTLEGFNETDIKVEIRHRVVYINAYKAETGKHYTQVKELPAFVDASEAKFTFEENTLQVVFPTKNTINNTCNPNINDNVINVTKFKIFDAETVIRSGQ